MFSSSRIKRTLDASGFVAKMIISSMERNKDSPSEPGLPVGRVPPTEFPLAVETFARGLLEADPKTCPGAAALSEKTKDKLRGLAAASRGIFRFP